MATVRPIGENPYPNPNFQAISKSKSFGKAIFSGEVGLLD
jgi:hypothetical protein